MGSSVKEVQSVRNACAVLECIARTQPVGVTEIARLTGVDKSAVHRLAITLHAAGWLDRTAQGRRWAVAPRLMTTVRAAALHCLVDAARPLLDRLRDETGETAMLVVPEADRLRIVAISESHQTLRVSVREGIEMQPRKSSALRALAAAAAPADLAMWRAVDPDLTDSVLADVRTRGWAVNDAELTDDTRAVGAALAGQDGSPVAALVLCGPSTRFTRKEIDAYGRLVASLAGQWPDAA